jgi:hypothetical protein
MRKKSAKQRRSSEVRVMITPVERAALERAARKHDVTLSTLARRAVQRLLREVA